MVTGSITQLAASRARYEHAVLRRFGSVLTREDAEDVVSEALLASGSRCPAECPDGAHRWFTRVVLNRAEDYRRARDGRPRSARTGGGGGNVRRLAYLEEVPGLEALSSDEPSAAEQIERQEQRDETRRTVEAALGRLRRDYAEILRLRHLEADGDGLGRQEVARLMGISLWRYETLYTKARGAFAQALVDVAPTEFCRNARDTLAASAQSTQRRFAEAHVAGCSSCQAFAREMATDDPPLAA
jgi:RNA polymerase sigma factor (sigma-70 family)